MVVVCEMRVIGDRHEWRELKVFAHGVGAGAPPESSRGRAARPAGVACPRTRQEDGIEGGQRLRS